MDYLPIFTKLANRPCLVVGGGDVALRKARLLLSAGAKVTVISPTLESEFREFEQQINYRSKYFEDEDVAGFFLVVSATNQTAVNTAVAESAERHHILVNVVDNPNLCNFIFPSIIDRSPVVAAISSGGASPVLARLLRTRLEGMIPYQYGKLADICKRFRNAVKQRISDSTQRRRFWEDVLQGRLAELVFKGNEQHAMDWMEQAIDQASHGDGVDGEVYLVGAGPGDPDLLTFRALRLMQCADIVVYDRLVSPEVLSLVRREAELIYAGKKRHKHTMAQEQLNDLLARLAKSGKRVVRLKGGDPFIFGRGGEEIERLLEDGVSFQVVPGITAASGCATYAGIPLTHRDHAQSCIFVTGQVKDGTVNLNWSQLAVRNQTIVIYMGLVGLETICRSLIEHGSSPDLPAALIQQGTTQNQRVVTGVLSTLPDLVKSSNIVAPTLVIIGTVVKLHKKLAWFAGDTST